MSTAEGFLSRLTRRLTEDPEARDAEELTDEAAHTGAQRAIDCQRGQEVTMVGTLRSVETNGRACSAGVRAELFDGTDTVTLVWLGQRRIPGIESGRVLRVRGRLGALDDGTKAIYNPRYEIER
ncbi:OB-fold nucleic acid binding domain-containing protein [Mycolicibacterium brumae]|uniref:DNA-binding protein n=1 Tax=Mycolicibacterium brumae TaxID=85968 RepID=A0A2G5PCQ5_9MYCO|nr:OB-fold nucleic acid binding domain-containing protein [Mycolicibacterium brumae]MCV7193516.1 OB-fold nucleic acid binding domain-containing protein [Mycolicibacterium brumae]PIB76097.1 DNA-binding protein [Mycolicibacterium brumae]RWA17213.1 DNA-binding protein [Mycolicibacterium brumae DSM 44177]UWW09211.1 OB-fold nucleic acid binding domain-containing protein [Mycolicibacterium brumae]